MSLTLYFPGGEMSNPYQAPKIAENNSNQPNAVHEYSAAEISQLNLCRMGAGLLLFVFCLIIIAFICGAIAAGLQLNPRENAAFLKVLSGFIVLAAICSFIANVMLLFSPERSGAKQLFVISFVLGIISNVGPMLFPFLSIDIRLNILTTFFFGVTPFFCLILFLNGWIRLGNFIHSETVAAKMKRARTAFCILLILPFIAFSLGTMLTFSGANVPTGLKVLIMGTAVIGTFVSAGIFLINYGNGLTLFRKAVTSISQGD
tara:strand:- start:77 stop:856 length:780 start_codon:yes stop_codon:yes gene_type:complete